MADNLQDVVEHITDGAVAQGYLTPEQAADARATAADGERPQLDFSNAPQSVRDAADHVLDQAQTQAQADAARAEVRAELDDRWANHQADIDGARADANELKIDLDAVNAPISAAETAVGHAADLLAGQPSRENALTNDIDLESYQTVPVNPQIRPYLDEATDNLGEARQGLIDVLEPLADQLGRANTLEAENDALWTEENAHRAVDATTAQTWSVLEGQADDAYITASDASAHGDDAHAAHAEPAHIEAAPHADDTHAVSDAHADAAPEAVPAE